MAGPCSSVPLSFSSPVAADGTRRSLGNARAATPPGVNTQRLIESARLPMDRNSTHQLPLADFQKGQEMVASGKGSNKVSLIP